VGTGSRVALPLQSPRFLENETALRWRGVGTGALQESKSRFSALMKPPSLAPLIRGAQKKKNISQNT
ncbi:MAG TPA: hypothetical protein DGO89_02655, partial [Microcoleaceae bacterium UBA9251]|nr:hypothetical protein [Microcoleaceae cyanobacterium UBA9251]